MKKRLVTIIISILLLTLFAVSLAGCIPKKHYDNVDKKLINPNASENAIKLYNFLLDNYGKKFLTGQFVNEYAG